MRLFIASEARLIAKNFNSKANKGELDPLVEYTMYLVNEAAKKGKFEVEVDLEEQQETTLITYRVIMHEMGYTVKEQSARVLNVSWI